MIRRLFLLALLCIASLAHADLLSFGSKPKFLPPDQAFSLEVRALDQRTLIASFNITPGYYLYRGKTTFNLGEGPAKIALVSLPEGETKNDPNFGVMKVFHNSFQAEIALEDVDPKFPLVLNASYQGCSDEGLCYPPIEKTITLNLVTTASNPAPAIAQIGRASCRERV